MNAARTVLTASTPVPKTRTSRRTHTIWYTSTHAPDTKNSRATSARAPVEGDRVTGGRLYVLRDRSRGCEARTRVQSAGVPSAARARSDPPALPADREDR